MRFRKGMRRLLIFAFVGIGGATVGSAAEPKLTYPLEPLEFVAPEFDPKDFKAQVKEMQEYAKRKIAQSDTFDETKALSEQYRNVRSQLIGGPIFSGGKKTKDVPGVKTPENIVDLLKDLQPRYDRGEFTSPDARVLVAQIQMLRPFMGFVFRAKQIFETSSGDARFAHAFAVTVLRTAASGIDIYLPNEEWKAGFDFSVQPPYAEQDKKCENAIANIDNWSNRCDIKDGETLKLWVRREFLPQLGVLHKALSEVKFNQAVYWDNQMFYKGANFVSHKDRYLRLGEVERLAMLAVVQGSFSALIGMGAYDLTGFFESFDTIAKVYGFQVDFDATNATSADRFLGIKKRHPRLFRFRSEDPESKKYMLSSYNWLKMSLRTSYSAWQGLNEIKADSTAQRNLIDPRLAAPFARLINTGFQNLFAVAGIGNNFAEVEKGEVLSAVVNGEKVTVLLKKFFTEPDNLQKFFPLTFDQGGEDSVKQVDGKPVEYRNYRRGKPISWDYKFYGRYFEGVDSNAKVEQTARVLSQSWGGFVLGLPIAGMML